MPNHVILLQSDIFLFKELQKIDFVSRFTLWLIFLLLILVALKRAQEEEYLDIIFVNERLIFHEKNLIK